MMDPVHHRVKRWVLGLGLSLLLVTTTGLGSLSTSQSSYLLGPNDVVRIHVYGEDDLTVESRIDGDGNLNFPLLGLVHVAGNTIQELQEHLTARLASGYVRIPKVTAYVAKYRNFYVSGEVKVPGGYPYEEGLSVQKAITMAGGVTERAERDSIALLRHVTGQEETLSVKLDSLLLPDDTIIVPEGQKFYVSGEVKAPGSFLYEKGLTVHKAVGIAGGRTEKAERGIVKMTRVTERLAKTIAVDPDIAVLPGDILVVEPQDYRFYASGEVKNPGTYPQKDGLTVHKAIAMAGGLTEKAERSDLHILRSVNGNEATLPVKLDTLVLPDDIIVVAEGQKFFVSGEVKAPGRYLYERDLTVHKAITMAGGFAEKAEKAIIKVTRIAQGVPHTMEMDLGGSVLPDDFIVIAQMHNVYVNGEVKSAGNFPYEKGLTIHKIITMAGGFTDKAAVGRTKVLRIVHGEEQSFRVNLDAIVLPDDIVVVPRSFF
jgi:protein involved in polysaccharide export with SLBB domain